MQWFIILFGLRASWTSSIIVIHRRKWAVWGSAGASGAPRTVLSRSPTLSTLARESRDVCRLRLTHSIFSFGVCVSSVIRYRSSTELRAVQQTRPSDPSVYLERPASVQAVSSTFLPIAQLTGAAHRLPANARWVRSMIACTRFTSLYVSISSHSRIFSRHVYVDHYRRLPKINIFWCHIGTTCVVKTVANCW